MNKRIAFYWMSGRPALAATVALAFSCAGARSQTGSITTQPSGGDGSSGALYDRGALGGSFGNGAETAGGGGGLKLFTPTEDVLQSTAVPVTDDKPSPGTPVKEGAPDLTGGQGISLDGKTASQKLSGEDEQEARDTRLGLGRDPGAGSGKFSRGAGEMTRTQKDALPGIDQLRDEKTGRTEFLWLDQAKFVKGPMEAPDRVNVRWKGREYVFRLYFVTSGDAGKVDSRRTLSMASNLMVKPEMAAEALTKAAAETQSWLEGASEVRVATRWEKVNPLKETTDYYAFIYLGEQSLAERLVEAGWADTQGKKVTGPNEERPSEILAVLQRHEEKARTKKIGLWGLKGGPKKTQFTFDEVK
jgi:hypothetical protein